MDKLINSFMNICFYVFFFFFCEIDLFFRGFPVWLKFVPGISFRTDNEPFKV